MNSTDLDADFVFALVAAAIGFFFYSALLILKYRKSVVLCTFLLVPLMLFFVMQQHARLNGFLLAGFGLTAVAVGFGFDLYFGQNRRSIATANIGAFADCLWDVLPAFVVPPLFVAGLRQPLSVEIVIPLAMLGCSVIYLANFGRQQVRRMTSKRRRSRNGRVRFGLRSLVLGGPLGVALYTSGLIGGSLVYFTGVSLFYGGLIQMPPTKQDVWSTRQHKTERRIRHGLVAAIFGLALMLAGVVNVMASSN